jgi:hypothetical protein
VDVLAAVSFGVGVLILGQALLQAGLTACFPVPTSALTPPLEGSEVNDVELLIFALGKNVEEELSTVLNSWRRLHLAAGPCGPG